jgi:biotin operon repressor
VKVITCPHCGKVAATIGIGRAATNIVVTDICDALRLCRSVPAAAEKLGCSRALVYKILKANGLTPADVIKGLATKDTRLLHRGAVND